LDVTRGAEPTPASSPASGEGLVAPRRPRHAAPDEDAPAPSLEGLETVLLPRFLEAPDEPPSLAELAKRHGLQRAAVRPKQGSYIAQLWRYRQFIGMYANGRVMASFGTTRLGRLWQIVSPLVNAVVYYLIFGVVLGMQREVENFIAYLCIGVFIFAFTQGVIQDAVGSISGHRGLVRALNFPRASLPIAQTLIHVQTLIGSMVVLVGVVLFITGGPITLEWLYVVPALALQFVFNLGAALLVARLGSKIPDLKQLLPYVLRLWFYASGVLYSVDRFAENLPAWLLPVIHANPLLVYIELVRHAMMENVPLASTPMDLWIMGGAWAIVAFVAGFVYFSRGEAEYGRG
jgi:teichoic acid transport system permease protein